MLVNPINVPLALTMKNAGYFSSLSTKQLSVTSGQIDEFDISCRNLFVGNIYSTGTSISTGTFNFTNASGTNLSITNITGNNISTTLLNFTQTGNNVAAGLNPADNNAFVLSNSTALGTNNFLRFDQTTNAINYPLQPAFYATKTSAQANVTGDGTNAQVNYNVTTLNVGSNYSTGTGFFRCPINGNYVFNVSIYFNGITTGTSHTSMVCSVNASGSLYTFGYGNASLMTDANGSLIMNGAIGPIPLIAGTQVGVFGQINGSSKTVNFAEDAFGSSRFAGYLFS